MEIKKLRMITRDMSEISALDTSSCGYVGCDDVYIAIQQKLIRVLGDKLQNEEGNYSSYCHQRGDTLFASVGSNHGVSSGYGDFLAETSGIYSDTVGILLEYYRKSPYWDVAEVPLDLEQIIDDNSGDEGCFFDMDPNAAFEMLMSSTYFFLETLFPCGFFESEVATLIESGELTDIKRAFKHDTEEYEDGMCVLSSQLYPYYLRNKELFDEAEEADIKLAVDSMCMLFGDGMAYTKPSLSRGYFISIDNGYYMTYGSIDCTWLSSLPLSIFTAGQVIDRLILQKDEKYHFLPDELRIVNAAKDAA